MTTGMMIDNVDGRKQEGGVFLILPQGKLFPYLFNCNIEITEIVPREKRTRGSHKCQTRT